MVIFLKVNHLFNTSSGSYVRTIHSAQQNNLFFKMTHEKTGVNYLLNKAIPLQIKYT